MIKFLGHKINMSNNCIDKEHRVFAPSEIGESCLMTGPNKPNYETFLEQESFLRNTYVLMHIDEPEKFYEIIKKNISNQEIISMCEILLEDDPKLKLGVKKYFLRELKSYVELGFDVSYYVNMCAIDDFNIALLNNFLQRKKITDEILKDNTPKKEQSNIQSIISKKRKIYQNLRSY